VQRAYIPEIFISKQIRSHVSAKQVAKFRLSKVSLHSTDAAERFRLGWWWPLLCMRHIIYVPVSQCSPKHSCVIFPLVPSWPVHLALTLECCLMKTMSSFSFYDR